MRILEELWCGNIEPAEYDASLIQRCRYARKYVGDEMYEHMMEIAAIQKARR